MASHALSRARGLVGVKTLRRPKENAYPSKPSHGRSRLSRIERLEERALLSIGGIGNEQDLFRVPLGPFPPGHSAGSSPPLAAAEAGEADESTQGTLLIDLDSYLPLPLPAPSETTGTADLGQAISYDLRTGVETLHNSAEPTFLESAHVPGDLAALTQLLTEADPGSSDVERDFSSLTRVEDPELFPYRVNCKIFINFNGSHYVGSGVLIDSMHVLTAGHCVYDSGEGGWATSITVVPAYENGAKPYGEANSVQLHSWTGWTSSADYNHDIGVIDLDRPIGALTSWYGYGYNNSETFFLTNTFHNPGYPAESPYDGKYMYYWYGNFDYFIPFTNQVGITSEGFGGQSGSGAYRLSDGSRTVYAVLSNGAGSFENFIRLTESKFKDIRDDYIAGDVPSTFDLIPLDVNIAASTINAGSPLSSMSYVVHNYSSASWSGTVNVDVYLSANDNITTSDVLLQSHSFTQSFGAKGTTTITVSNPPTIPVGTATGDYYIGVILSTSDHDTGNNDTDGWDAAPLHVNYVNQSPTISALPDINLSEDTGLDNAIDLWAFVADPETTDSGLTYAIVGNTNTNCGVIIDANRYLDVSPTANWNGSSDVTVRVTDPQGLSVQDTFRVTVTPVNDAPTISALPDIALDEDTSLDDAIDLRAQAADLETADADLTYAIVGNTSPACGVSIDSQGRIDVRPTANWNGTSDVTIRVSDPQGLYAQDTFRVTVNPVNDAPVAINDTYPLNEDVALTRYAYEGVLVNDSDPDSLSIQAIMLSGPAHGTLTLGASGWFTYQPDANYHGTDSFKYRAFDGQAYSAPATVSLVVASINDIPVAGNDNYVCDMGATLVRYFHDGVLVNDSDADNNDGDPANDVQLQAVLVSGPSHGTLTLGTTGWFSYRPNSDYYGTDSFTYRTYDQQAYSAAATVTIVVRPRIPGDADRSGTVDEADARIMAAHWGMTSGMTWSDGDFNADGRVNVIDAAILAANFGRSASERASVAPLPSEPRIFIGPLLANEAGAARPLIRRVAREAASATDVSMIGTSMIGSSITKASSAVDGDAADSVFSQPWTVGPADNSVLSDAPTNEATHDAALVQQFGPQLESAVPARQRVAWSNLLARRSSR